LIHELVHAYKDFHDVTRNFELELTRIIGILAGTLSKSSIIPNISESDDANGAFADLKKQLSGYVSLANLFPPSFMAEYSTYESIQSFFDEMPTHVMTQAEYDDISIYELDKYVMAHTPFLSWRQMVSRAAPIYLANKLEQLKTNTYEELIERTVGCGVDNIFEYINVHLEVRF